MYACELYQQGVYLCENEKAVVETLNGLRKQLKRVIMQNSVEKRQPHEESKPIGFSVRNGQEVRRKS
jgi:hypothetical protein